MTEPSISSVPLEATGAARASDESSRSDREIFGTLKEEARRNVKRIDPLGQQLHASTMRLFVQPGLDMLAKDGEPDTRCGTCAFRTGTIPGGCIQTQADALKAIMEDTPFMCHAHEVNGDHRTLCHGWFAARVLMGDTIIPAPWPWVEDLAREEAAKADERRAIRIEAGEATTERGTAK